MVQSPDRRKQDFPVARWLAPRVPALIAFTGLVLVIALTFQVFAQNPLISGDLATYVLPTFYRQEGFGTIYADIFDVKPPMVYTVLRLWVSIIGIGLPGLWILYAVLLLFLGILFWNLLRVLVGPWISLVLFASSCFTIVGLSMFEEILFTTEALGLCVAFGGLLLAWKIPRSPMTLGLAACALTLAGQSKEVFLLSPLALVPFILVPRLGWGARLVGFLAGLVVGVLATFLILVSWGSGTVSAYLEILQFKRRQFSSPGIQEGSSWLASAVGEILGWTPILGLLPVVIGAAILALVVTARDEHAPIAWRPDIHVVSACLFAGTVLVGLAWQGAPVVLHYAIAAVFPLFLVGAALVRYLGQIYADSRLGPRSVVIGAVIVCFLPATSSVAWSMGRTTGFEPSALATAFVNLETEEEREPFRVIRDVTSPTDCIQVAYGWTAASYYLYSDRSACSRFVIPPLALDAASRRAMQEELIADPPRVLVMNRDVKSETALPPEEGLPENVIFPFESVARNCYVPIEGSLALYVPRGDDASVRACIRKQIANTIR